jgi:hypothetical protein
MVVILILLVTGIWFGMKFYTEKRVRYTAVTVYNRFAGGTSLFYDWMNSVQPGAAVSKSSALLNASELKGVDAFLIFSPRAALSPREIDLVERFVAEGGKVLLAFHGDISYELLRPLLRRWEMAAELKPNPGFHNREPQVWQANEDSALFQKAGKYAFYTSRLLARPTCRQSEFDCVVWQKDWKKGHVVLLAGLPLVSNGVLQVADNRQFALRLEAWAPHVLIDEYRHFFSDKTWMDLLREPSVAVPLLGFLTALLCFLVFAYTQLHQVREATADPEPRSYHAANEAIALGTLNRRDAWAAVLRQHQRFLKRLFPDEADRLAPRVESAVNGYLGKASFLGNGRWLLRAHRAWLIKRGRA